MATVTGTLAEPIDEAVTHLRGVAAAQGWSLFEGAGGAGVFVFKRGASLLSWGATITVQTASLSPTTTELKVIIQEVFAVTDWGRGRRAAERLLDALGAHREG